MRLLSVIVGSLAVTVNAIWPEPRSVTTGSTFIRLSADIELDVVNQVTGSIGLRWAQEGIQSILAKAQGKSEEWIADQPETILKAAFERFRGNVLNAGFIPRKFFTRDGFVEYELGLQPEVSSRPLTRVELIIESKASYAKRVQDGSAAGEGYQLFLSPEGTAKIVTASTNGGLYALSTLEQLFYTSSHGHIYTVLAPISITDSPMYSHRGLNLDISRNFIAPSDAKRVISALSFNKMNRLHIHATDAQSWPLVIPSIPSLAEKGAYEPDQVWTAEDLADVQRYGRIHGVEVYLEIDVPGHTTSIAASHPNLITAATQDPWTKYAAEPPSGQLKLDSPAVYTFLTKLFNDILPRSAFYSKHFHFGGDELNRAAYELDDTVKSSDPTILKPLVQKFTDHILSMAKKHSLRPILWEEMVLDWNLTLPSNTIIQTWRSSAIIADITSRGHAVLFGANTHWYLDCGMGVFLDPIHPMPGLPGSPPPTSHLTSPPFPDYCSPYKNWRHIYTYDPLANITLSAEQEKLVLGGEVHLWGEMTDAISLDGMLWPRVSAAAEVLWRGGGRSVDEGVTRRLAEMRERLVGKGVSSGMVQMEWCLRNKGMCKL
ncbi:hypothetical protein EJ05DRAFT_448580 [Pseudovirgaria hyperparasitica]|uniref:Beta-hexosaminidase n=1 Tax=Pseudovirgaria hyperparasitica TaxID=470096 RepID=A0A6A6WHD8_9PEZI|nr:uncharacterized protein EJ05DRAFT_448580 [Pseudovirgaria hyperparasitica]KAF2762208.1 hypothetical protein EJ05DRAFT_448580 [Pseudovirgaria hyperparasitica]